MKKIYATGIFILVAFAACRAQETVETASAQDAGFHQEILDQITELLKSDEYPNVHGLLMARDGKLFYEEYFEGNDQIWGSDLGVVDFGPDDLHDMRSVSKSIVSACIGIAIHQGYIAGVDQKISDFFPEHDFLKDGDKSQWTLDHFLSMTTGLDWNENIP